MACILLVEDNPGARLLVQYMLGPTHTLHAAPDSRSALELASQRHYDVVLMDINLGDGLNGVDLLRREPDYASVPFVALTAYAQPGDESHFRSIGFQEYVSKPFTRAQLQRALLAVLPPEN